MTLVAVNGNAAPAVIFKAYDIRGLYGGGLLLAGRHATTPHEILEVVRS